MIEKCPRCGDIIDIEIENLEDFFTKAGTCNTCHFHKNVNEDINGKILNDYSTKYDTESWNNGFESGLNPTEDTIVNGCPENKNYNKVDWLEGFVVGQKKRKN